MAIPGISVIIRARGEAASLARCLDALSAQQGSATSRSSSSTAARVIARHTSPPSTGPPSSPSQPTSSPSAALSTRSEGRASSADPRPLGPRLRARRRLLARLTAVFSADDRVACACGDRYGPDGHPLTRPVVHDAALAPPATGLGVRQRRRGVSRREAEGYAAFLDDPPGPATPAALARAWWSDTRWYGSPARARLSHRRAARLYGAYAGWRQGAASSSSSGAPRA
jgi:hypothetical protein